MVEDSRKSLKKKPEEILQALQFFQASDPILNQSKPYFKYD